jgi:Uncharacterised nucleotidyltransferase
VTAASAPSIAPAKTSSGRPAEPALLLATARLSLDRETEDRVRTLASSPIDWDGVLVLAERHRLIPFLHRHLPVLIEAGMPEPVATTVRDRHREDTRRSLRLTGELRRLIDLLQSAGIDVLPYKGPTLAMRAYGALSARTYVDLDVLVRAKDVPKALGVLEGGGYESVYRFTPAQDACFRQVDGDYPLVHRTTGTLVELHCRVSSERFGIAIDTDGLMRRARPVALGGTTVPAPADDDLLLILAAHGAKHRWKRLEWVAAVAELVRPGTIDLAAVLNQAQAVHGRRAVLLALALAHRLLDAPLPDDVVRETEADATVGRLADEAEGRMWGPDGEEDTAANLRYNLRVQDRTADKIAYAWRWTTTPSPEDWAWARLPDALFPLYRVLRPLRLAIRYAPRPARRP